MPEESCDKARSCSGCELASGCHGVVPMEYGPGAKKGKVDVLFVGEAPGGEEDEVGRPFIGPAGQLLRQAVYQLKIDKWAVTNTVKCRPPNNRDPKKPEIVACEGRLRADVKAAKPKLIVAVGGKAAPALTGLKAGITKVAGRVSPGSIYGPMVFPVLHTSAVLHKPGLLKQLEVQFTVLGRVIDRVMKGLSPVKKFRVSWNTTESVKESLRVISKMSKKRLVSFDYETECLSPHLGEIFCMSFCSKVGEAYCIPGKFMADEVVRAAITLWLANTTPKLCFNAFFESIWSKVKFGVWPRTMKSDPMLEHYTIDETPPHNLTVLTHQFTDIGGYDNEVLDLKAAGLKHHEMPAESVYRYNAGDADAALRVHNAIAEKMTDVGRDMHDNLLLPSAMMLARISDNGMVLNTKKLHGVGINLRREVKGLMVKMGRNKAVKRWKAHYEFPKNGDGKFNPKSTPQKRSLLFGKSGLRLKSIMKTKAGGQSTDSEVLEALEDAHPVIGMIKEYNEKTTLVSNFTVGLPACVRYDGMVHSRFSLTNTPTGQVACEDPNVMAIPTQEAGRPIKQCFESRYGKKGVLISGDYSQLELRLVASVSRDARMIDGFNNGIDFHTLTASLVFGVPLDEVTKEMRYIAKRINFGIIYGISAPRLARKIKVSKGQAADFLRSYFKEFYGVRAWIARVRGNATDDEQVTAWFGMVRHLPMVNSDDWIEREEALRQAVSFVIQNTGRQICLKGLLNTQRRLEKAGLADKVLVCNTVHDSILLDAPYSLEKKARAILYKGMAKDVGREVEDRMKVELKVDINSGPVWGA